MRFLISLTVVLLLATQACAGTSGPGSFDNDDALDWIAECVAAKDAQAVTAALKAALGKGPLEAPSAAAAVAAAEVVAAARGKPAKGLPPELREWVERQAKPALTNLAPMALQALGRVKDPKISELRQLWAESQANPWLAAIADLERRLVP